MRASQLTAIGFVVIAGAVPAVMAVGGTDNRQEPTGLVRDVRQATRAYLDVNAALAAGYSSAGSCVSGPEFGAMGVHFANPTLLGDAELDAAQPEILVYEQRNGRLRLLAVEYVVLAEQWDAKKIGPPVLNGQHFHYVGAPNRYGSPAFYELHVWAWKHNPGGMFADWNPNVSCDEYSADSAAHSASMHGGH
jgi:hypothetical protein